MLRGFWDEVEKRGVSRAQLEYASGAPYPRTGDFASTISESAMHSLFEAAESLTRDPALGLTAGRAIGASGFHLIGHLSLACTNLAARLRPFSARVSPPECSLQLLADEGRGDAPISR